MKYFRFSGKGLESSTNSCPYLVKQQTIDDLSQVIFCCLLWALEYGRQVISVRYLFA